MKKWARLLCLCMSLMVLGGCAGQKAGSVMGLDGLCNEAGDFQYMDWAWDSSLEEVEDSLGVTLEAMGSALEYDTYSALDAIEWNGEKGNLMCEFKDDKLTTVSILWQPDDNRDEFWTKLQEEAIACYGNVEKNTNNSTSEQLGITTESESLLWEKNESRHTALMIDKFSSNGEFKYIRLSVYVIPE